MLKFILGRASSGKSYHIVRKIAECVRAGETPVLIVPEQFSFESEKRVLFSLGDSDAQKVKVLSFSRLCDEVENIVGGRGVGELTDSDKIIIMSNALHSTRDKLKYFGRYVNSTGFAKMMLNTVGEFEQNTVSVADIYEAAESIEDSVFKRKLYDTALIFAEYNEQISEKFLGFEDKLTRLYSILGDYKYFEGKTVFIDSFSGFTGQQYRIIDRILTGAKDLFVSFTDNPQDVGNLNIFANIKKAQAKICAIAQKHGVKRADDVLLESGKYVSDSMAAIEEYMCRGNTQHTVDGEVSVCCGESEYDEAQFVARNIRRIVRTTGAKYNEFAVIARNAADYEQVISTAFNKNNIPCFTDKRLPLYSLPPAALLTAAIECANSITTEKILHFHKCGAEFLSGEELSELENYAYIWNIDKELWQKNWDMDPGGLEGKKMTEDELKEFFDHINELRIRAIAPINEFSHAFKGSSQNMALAAVRLLESAKGYFLNISEDYKLKNSALSDGMAAAYSKVMKILDSIVNCLPENASRREFADAFKTCAGIESIGVIPQMIDEVLFGSADRIQPARPSYVFILGANQGVLPRAPQANGIFAVSEIGKLINLGIDIPDCSVYSAIDEELLVYNCVCCADKGVFISYNKRSGEPSRFVKRLTERLCLKTEREPGKLTDINLPETAEGAFSRFCRTDKDGSDYATLKSALDGEDEYKARLRSVCDNYKRPFFNIPAELSKKLVGKRIGLSPSKFDTYSKCPFMYFCKYVLSVKSDEPVSFTSLQTGTFIHYVLQKFIEETGDRVADIGKDEIHAVIEKHVNAYLDSFKGYRELETPHLKFMVAGMTDTLKYLGERLVKEFAQADFKPQKCELKIGYEGDIPSPLIPVDDEVSVTVSGSVDRVDRYKGYIRIIDYKTGSLEFKLPDLLVGQNMQMLIYLYAVCSDKTFGGEPAGVFYMHAAMPDEDTAKARRMNGFMPEDDELIFAMDKSNAGEYIPLSSPKARKRGTTEEDFYDIFDFVQLKLKQTGRDIAAGRFLAEPVDGRDKGACEYCEFASICRIEDEKIKRVEKLSDPEVIDEIKRQVSENGI